MKVSIVNTYDSVGGAARSAYRLHRGLLESGCQSGFYTQHKVIDDLTVQCDESKFQGIITPFRSPIDGLPARLYSGRDKGRTFSVAAIPASGWTRRAAFNADIVNLHWVASGYVNIESLKNVMAPIVWTLHDSWPFTGGCHVPHDCMRYTDKCGQCPQLSSTSQLDLSRLVLARKKRSWAKLNITVVTPSIWLADCARRSLLFRDKRIEIIPNGLDLKVFRPIDKKVCREILGLPEDSKVILFGASRATSDENKGFQFIQPSLIELAKSHKFNNVKLLVFGASEPKNPPDMAFESHYAGRLHDDIALAVLYSAADVMLVPSMQENLPNTVMESLACGTPVVAFNIGGIPDMVEHRKNGYLAQPFDPIDLAKGLAWVLEDEERWSALSKASLNKVTENFDIREISRRYNTLFDELLTHTP